MKSKISLFFLLLLFLSCTAQAETIKWKEDKSDHFVIYYSKASQNFVDEVKESAEGYYRKISEGLRVHRIKSWTWDDRAKIYVFDDKESYLTQEEKAWSAGVTHVGRKEINTYPSAAGFFDSTLPHELAHIIFHELVGLKADVPLWFDEGVAMYYEQAKRWGAHLIVKKTIKDGTFMPLQDLSRMQLTAGTDPEKVSQFYAESASIVNFMIEEQGEERFHRLCEKLQEGNPFEWTLENVYIRYRTLDQLNKEWTEFLKHE